MKDFILKYLSRLLAVIGCGTLVTACYGVPYEKFSTKVSCTVVDADNGAPIKGIQVRMTMGYRPSAGDNTVAVHIRHLRSKIDKISGDKKYIETIYGGGYKLSI